MATHIKVPSSSANIGPGFDVIGLALNLYLELEVTVTRKESSEHSLNCRITYEGVNAEDVPLIAEDNLITRTAVYVLRCHGVRAFPPRHTSTSRTPYRWGEGWARRPLLSWRASSSRTRSAICSCPRRACSTTA